jgi:hypothetical protein
MKVPLMLLLVVLGLIVIWLFNCKKEKAYYSRLEDDLWAVKVPLYIDSSPGSVVEVRKTDGTTNLVQITGIISKDNRHNLCSFSNHLPYDYDRSQTARA